MTHTCAHCRVHKVFHLTGDPKSMIGVSDVEAARVSARQLNTPSPHPAASHSEQAAGWLARWRSTFLRPCRHIRKPTCACAVGGACPYLCAQLISGGKQSDLLDKIYSAYVAYKESHDFVLVQVSERAEGAVARSRS